MQPPAGSRSGDSAHAPARSNAGIVRPVGATAFLLELGSLDEVMAVRQRLSHPQPLAALGRFLPGIVDVVAAATTVLVRCESPRAMARVQSLLAGSPPATQHDLPRTTAVVHRLKTMYDGADLAEAASQVAVSVEALVRWHAGQDWVAAFGGFAPGFMYLTASLRPLSIPRRASPRTLVPAGSVAVGGEFSAVYPGPTPGGWQLLGRCQDTFWDPERAEPALIQPGELVRFEPVRQFITLPAGSVPKPAATSGPGTRTGAGIGTGTALGQAPPSRTAQSSNSPSGTAPPVVGLEILDAGVFTTVQDLGRPGYAHLGVPASGALDRAALRRANRMVGNAMGGEGTSGAGTSGAGTSGAAALEIVVTSVCIRAVGDHVLAVTGPQVQLTVDASLNDPEHRSAAPVDAPFVLRDGQVLTIQGRQTQRPPGPSTHQPPPPHTSTFRSYVAVRGGLATPSVLGSRATDVLSGLGPAMVQSGDFLPVTPTHQGIVGNPEPSPTWYSPVSQQPTVMRYAPGPRQDWFTAPSLADFELQAWHVSAQSNRIGLRLEPVHARGRPLQRTPAASALELPSEGMADGAIQVPPSGLPVLFLADHPVTGGYPVIGVVLPEDLAKAAQLGPGALVTFRAFLRR